MSRLLLVDDNPSIHKIAETLLARTGIELVCLETAAQALDLIERGERFDVILLDTAMPGMDGWELLEQLRKHPITARVPIAMMAGVLDTVDPVRIQKAPIQGFLKKPVELRDLVERIHKLLETPVDPVPAVEEKAPASPLETMPATNLKDLPELRHLNADKPVPAVSATPRPPSAPMSEAPAVLDFLDEPLDDVLDLTEADLLTEDEMPGTVEVLGASAMLDDASPEESLDLEELDLESLRELPPPAVEVSVAPAPLRPMPVTDAIADLTPPQGYAVPDPHHEARATFDTPGFTLPRDAKPEPEEPVDLPDLGPLVDEPLDLETVSHLLEPESLNLTPSQFPSERAFAEEEADRVIIPPELEPHIDLTEDSDSLLSALGPMGTPLEPHPSDLTEAGLQEMPDTEILPDAPLEEATDEDLDYLEETLSGIGTDLRLPDTAQSPVPDAQEDETAPGAPEAVHGDEAPPIPVPAAKVSEAPGEAALVEALAKAKMTPAQRDILDSVLADPALMDALSKAVVVRLGDQVLREIAWEVIPELAERLPHR